MADLCKGEYNGLPDRDVRTIRDLIHYQYAKIIARSAFSVPDGTTAKDSYYGFIKQTFRELHNKLIYLFVPLLPSRAVHVSNQFTLHQRPLRESPFLG